MANTVAKLTFDEEFTTMPTTSPSGYDASGNPTWRTEWFWGARYFDPSDGGYWADSTVGYNPFSDTNGVVSITAKPLSQTSATGEASYNTHATGMLTTDKLFAQTYGYFEFRAQAASGNGFGTALWLIPQDHSWPPELDAQEIPGSSVGNGHMIMTTHSNSTGSHVADGGWSDAGIDLSAGMHTYGMDWGPNEVVWYLDGKEVRRTVTPPDCNKPMYIVLSLHCGTADSWWGNAADDASATMKVDYVRAWDWQSPGPPQGAVGGPNPIDQQQPANSVIGSGPDHLVLKISQDAYLGDATYTVAVDGVQVGAVLTAGAAHGAGQDDTVTVNGNFAPGPHTVTVTFTNDAWAGAGADRNLYVDSMSLNGTAIPGGTATLSYTGSTDFAFAQPGTDIGSGPDSLVLKISEDAYQGDATYTVSVDGIQVGTSLTAHAAHAAGQDDTVTVHGNFAPGPHTVTVTFTNDAWAGNGADRNLYVDGISLNGTAVAGGTATLSYNGSTGFALAKPGLPAETVPALLFGTPGTWGQGAAVAEGHTTYGSTDYHSFTATPDWGSPLAAKAAPTTWAATNATHLAFDNFKQTNIDLHAAGKTALDLMVVSAKYGALITGDGNDTITWVAQSDTATGNNTMVIRTGGGNDTVHVTAAGLSPLAQHDSADNGSLYNPAYAGRGSIADVSFGAGTDSVTVDGSTRLVLHASTGAAKAQGGDASDTFYAAKGTADFTGGAGNDWYVLKPGNGHVTVEDFASGHDHLQFLGLHASDITTKAATEAGITGLLVTYDTAHDSVFLGHVTKLAASDLVFA